MDIIAYSQQLHHKLKGEIEAITVNHLEGAQRAASMMRVSLSIVLELKEFLRHYTFAGPDEEILFFKANKPVLVSQYLFYKRLFAITMHVAYLDIGKRMAAYQRMLKKLNRFADKHKTFFRYCMSGETTRDREYFSRSGLAPDPFVNHEFSTGYDDILASMLAHEMIRHYIHESIRKLSSPATSDSGLNWTGKKTDLVELLYALHASGSINHDQVEVKQLANALEDVFHISLGNYYDYVKKIALRKKGQTPFIEALREKLLIKLEHYDE